MRLRLTPRALAEAKRIKTWWHKRRQAAPDLFDDELDATLAQVLANPKLGLLYELKDFKATVYRILMPLTHHHVYYAVQDDELVVLSVWGAPKERGPRL